MTLLIYLILCSLFALTTSQSSTGSFNQTFRGGESGDTPENIFVNRSVRCGNEILNETSGSIEYKVSERLQPNERCVWLIRFVNATGYSVTISSLGFPEQTSDHKLTITGFGPFNEAVNVVPDRLGLYNFNFSNALVVTLHTGTAPSVPDYAGFSLGYSTYVEETSLIAPRFLDGFYEMLEEGTRGQATATEIEAYNLHFVFYTWQAHAYNPEEKMKFVIAPARGFRMYDIWEVYTYDVDSNWNLNTALEYFWPSTIETSDLMFVVFRSTSLQINKIDWYFVNFRSHACKG